MIIKNSKTTNFEGPEGTSIKQHFHPKNTLNGIRFSLAECTLKEGKRSLRHKLKSSEVYYILEGNGMVHIDEESFRVSKDDSVYVPPLSVQFIENTGAGNLRFLCIVDPSWKPENETILE